MCARWLQISLRLGHFYHNSCSVIRYASRCCVARAEPCVMPKELIPAGWVKAPCTFLLRPTGDRAELCGACEGEFGGWWASNSRRHCRFCGYLFHRQGCTHKIQLEGEFFRQRICSKCHYYRSTAQLKLQEGVFLASQPLLCTGFMCALQVRSLNVLATTMDPLSVSH